MTKQIGDARIAALLREQGRDLAAMMSLMVEDMGDSPPERRLVLLAAAHVHERGGEPLVGEPGDPGRELAVGKRSLPAEVLEIEVELLACRALPGLQVLD